MMFKEHHVISNRCFQMSQFVHNLFFSLFSNKQKSNEFPGSEAMLTNHKTSLKQQKQIKQAPPSLALALEI